MWFPHNIARLCALSVLSILSAPSLMAQTEVPFDTVNDSTYQNTMTITGYVCLATLADGQWTADEVLGNETVVAVYCGDELRGKSSPADYNDKYFSLLMMTVYGENKDKLHFKVFIPGDSGSPGRVIEVDQGVTFKTDDRLGKAKEPYYILLPTPVSTTFSSEGWATTCLPYDAKVPEGVTVWNVTGIEDSELVTEELQLPTITSPLKGEGEVTILPKNTPVLLQGSDQDSYEWLSRVVTDESATAGATGTTGATGFVTGILVGTTEPTDIAANTVLTLGHSKETGEIGFWLYPGATIPAIRAYIADFPTGTNGARIAIDGGTTGISSSEEEGMSSKYAATVYDLQGRPLLTPHSQLKSGIYIINGRKVVIK